MSSYAWTSAQSGNWSNQSLWSPNGAPGSSDDVTINAVGQAYVVTINTNVAALSLTVADDDATVSLQGSTITAGNYSNGAGSTLSGFGDIAAVFTNEGSVIAQGGTLEFTVAADVFGGTVSGTGTVEIAADATLDGATISVSNLVVQGAGVTVSVDDDVTVSSNFQIGAGAVLAVGGALTLSGVNAFNGGVNGAGALSVAGGSTTFNAGATIEVDDFTQSGGTIVFDESLTFANTLQQSAGVISVGLDDVLTLSGDDTFAGTIAGPGLLNLTGKSVTFAGAPLTISAITAGADEALTFDDSVSYAGILDELGGTIQIGADDTLTFTGTETLGGAVSGGTLDIGGGVTTLTSAGALSVSDLIVGAGAELVVVSGGDEALQTTSNAGAIFVESSGGAAGVSFDDDVTQAATGVIKIGDGVSAKFAFNVKGGAIKFGAGADEVLAVDDSTIGKGVTTFGATVESFGIGDSIGILGTAVKSLSATVSGGDTLLTVDTADDDIVFTLAGNYSDLKFSFDNTSVAGEALVTLKPITSTPTLSGVSALDKYYETAGALVVDPKVNVHPSQNEITGATVRISHGFRAGDTLDWNNFGAVVGTYNASNGVLTLTGAGSAATYAAVLDSVSFDTTAGSASDKKRTLTITVTSGSFTSAAATTQIDIMPAPPSLVVTASNATFTQGGSSISVDSHVSITSATAAKLSGAKVKIGKGFMRGDVLSFVGQPGITGVYNAATGVLSLKGIASLAEYQLVLDSVTFSSTSANPTDYGKDFSRLLYWTVTAQGGGTSKRTTTAIGIVGVDAAPTLLHGGNTDKYRLGKAAVVVDAAIKAKDVDNLDLASASVDISAGYQTGDTLSYSLKLAAKYGLSVAFDSAEGVLTLIGQATLAQYDKILETVAFSTTSTNTSARTLSWTVSDGTKTSGVTTSTIKVAAAAPHSASFDFNAASSLIAAPVSFAEAGLGSETLPLYRVQSGWLAESSIS
jgi:hypothetical protein